MNTASKHILLIFSLLAAAAVTAQQKAPEKQWWKEAVFYQIYMPSYADSNGDGYGDFRGIKSKLGYLEDLGVRGIWLTPFLKSPKVDNGYDVADYYAVDPTYGSMHDFDAFIKDAHSKGIKVIMDMVLNHTSTDSHWFQEAIKSKDNPYRDYYIWRDKPNNWESFFGGTAWQYEPGTQQYYNHKFDVRMADLNWRNPKVRSEVQKLLRFWLDRGVDGFRLDVINFLTTDGITADNPVKDGKQQHVNDVDQQGVKDAMKMIKATVSEYKGRFIVGEIGSDKLEVLKQYQSQELLDVVFNFNFGSIPSFSSERIFAELQQMEQHMSSYPTLFFGSHDMPRMIDRLAAGNAARAEALAALILTAKGVPFIYYGEEIGMQNIIADKAEEIIDIQGKTHYTLALGQGKTPAEALAEGNAHNRDKSRSPMQWDAGPYSGFSRNKSWIKLGPHYRTTNVSAQQNNDASLLKAYQRLIALRNAEPALQYGHYVKLEHHDGLIVYTRVLDNDAVTTFINFGKETVVKVPANAKVVAGTVTLAPDSYLIYKECYNR